MSFWCRSGVCSNNQFSGRELKNTGSRVYRRLGAFASLCAVGVMANAQDALPPGLIANLDVTQRLEYSDNPDLEQDGESDFFGRTILDFGLLSETSLDSFGLNIGTEIEEGRNDQSSLNLTNTFFRLNYERATRNNRIGGNLQYRESDTNSEFFDDDFNQDGSVINQDNGTRQSYGFRLTGATGIEAPIGTNFSLDYNETTFSGTNDPDLTDRSDLDFSGQINFRIDPRVIARLTAGYSDFDAQGNGVSRERTALGAGVLLDITQTLQGDFALSYDNIERSGDEVGSEDGITFNGRLTQEVTNGTWGIGFESDVSSNDDGRRNFLRVERDMALARGSLSYSVGGTNSESSDFDPLADVSYTQRWQASQLTLGLSQFFNSDPDNNEEINTTLRAGYQYQVNSLSSLGANISFFDNNELGLDGDDGQRFDLRLTYEHSLTQDWGVVAGYSYVQDKSDTQGDRNSNTVFIGLQRNFSWVP